MFEFKARLRALFASVILICMYGSPVSAQVATQSVRDIASLDHILHRAVPGKSSVAVDDMHFVVDKLQSYRGELAARANKTGPRLALYPMVTKWPDGVVPYSYDTSVTASNKEAFEDACREWEKYANVHFVPSNGTGNRLLVTAANPGNYSYVGMVGTTDTNPAGAQTFNITAWGAKYVICHELAHALGMLHEQSRSDRDQWVVIRYENILPDKSDNFDIVPGSLNQGPYEYDSTMHYFRSAFGIPDGNGGKRDTIEPISANYSQWIEKMGQQSYLSAGDKSGMALIYGSPGTTTPSVKSVAYPTPSTTAVTETSASLHAKVFNRHTTGDIHFDFGLTTNYGYTSSGIGIVSGDFDSQSFKSDWTNLSSSTTYHWRARYVSGGVTYFGSDQAFTTSGTTNVPDTIAPSIAIATPANNAVVASLPAISGTANDNVGVVRVDLYLQRKGDNKFWNGSVWTTATPLSTVLSGAAPRQWARNSGLPAGSNLLPGLYFIAARSYDAAGNGTSATRNFTVSSADRTPPAIAISSPANNVFLKALPALSGTASDNLGVTRVDLYLQRKSDNKFWNGSAWTTSTPLSTVLNGFSPRNWSRTSGLPTGAKLVSGAYFLAARAYDAAGNGTSATSNFVVDTIAPAITISSPANNAAVVSLPAINGTASDNTGVTRVDLYLQRKSDNKFWNGSTWTTSTPLSTVLNGFSPRRWSRTSGLPTGANLLPGIYFLAARAYDTPGNGTSATIYFSVRSGAAVATTSPIQLSNASAKSNGTIRLTFTGALGESASDAANYSVASDAQMVAVANASQPNASTVELTAAPLSIGARVSVNYDIKDAQGRAIKGIASVTVK